MWDTRPAARLGEQYETLARILYCIEQLNAETVSEQYNLFGCVASCCDTEGITHRVPVALCDTWSWGETLLHTFLQTFLLSQRGVGEVPLHIIACTPVSRSDQPPSPARKSFPRANPPLDSP